MARTRFGNAMIVGNLTGPLHGYIGRRSCRRTQLDDRNGYKIHAIAPFYAQQHRPPRSCPRFFDIATDICGRIYGKAADTHDYVANLQTAFGRWARGTDVCDNDASARNSRNSLCRSKGKSEDRRL